MVSLGLAYAAVSETVSAVLVRSDPDVATLLRPDDAEARLASAESQVNNALSPSEIEAALNDAKKAVQKAPVSALGLRTLAQAYQLVGDEDKSRKLMVLAGQRNLRDTTIQLWLFRRSLEARRFDDAYVRADLLLRRNADLAQNLFPAMASALDQPAARDALLIRLRTAPSWRPEFIRVQAQSGDEAGIAPWLLTNLAGSPHPATANEVGFVVSGLSTAGKWGAARDVWTRLGPPGGALLFNGDFEQPAREPPFGWKFENRDGSVASVEPLDGGGRGLFAQFPVGRIAPLGEMLVMLKPGHYRFSGRAKADQLPAGGLFRWSITCPNIPAPLTTSELTAITGWRKFSADFDIPQANCEAQWLRLGGTGGGGYQPAMAWFDDLRIDPLP